MLGDGMSGHSRSDGLKTAKHRGDHLMSDDHHGHSLPEAHPDTDDYGTIQKLILGVVVFMVVSMGTVSWWLNAEIERVEAERQETTN